MIISSSAPYTKEQISQLREQFDTYIKTVIDVEKKICIAGMDRHYEGEQQLLATGSKQSNLWGGGIELEAKEIDYNSFINIRPHDNNPSNEILDKSIRVQYGQLTKFFFQTIYD